MKIGWEYVTWSGDPEPCVACPRRVNAGHCRVDRARPQDGDPVLCVDCYGMIMMGVDPDPGASTPAWELENRERRLQEMVDREQ